MKLAVTSDLKKTKHYVLIEDRYIISEKKK